MTAIPGTNVAATITPFDTTDTYATHDEQYGAGGYRTVATYALRDAIPSGRRRSGMRVKVLEADSLGITGRVNELGADLATWTPLKTDGEVATAIGQKVDSVSPLSTNGPTNAVLNRYGSTGTVPTGQGANSGTAAAAYVFDSDWSSRYAEPNVLELTDTASAANKLVPVGGYFISPADLASIGVVPNDTTPPTISLMASILMSNLTNLQISTTTLNPSTYLTRFFIILRYAGANGSTAIYYPSSNSTTDVVFNSGPTGNSTAYAAAGDSRWSGIAESGYANAVELCTARLGIPIPATLNGNALTGILIVAIGKSTAAGAVKLRVGKCAIVAGSTLDVTRQVFNPADNALVQLRASLASTNTTIASQANDILAAKGLANTKVPYQPPLVTSVVNAAKYRFGSTSTVPTGQGANVSGMTAAYVYDSSWYGLTGEPNLLEVSAVATAANQYVPCGGYFISAADLATIGVVANDANPPLVSIMAAIAASGLTNTTALPGTATAGTRIYIDLRYGTNTVLQYPSNASQDDIVFVPTQVGNNTAFGGAGDSRWSTIPDAGLSNANEQRCVRQGVPVPATQNGKPFLGIFVTVVGYSLAAGTSKIRLGRVAVVAGATIDQSSIYLNPADNPVVQVAALAQAATSAAAAAALLANTKLSYTPPLAPVSYVNAVRNRYTADGSVPSPHGAETTSGMVASYEYNDALYQAYAEPNCLKITGTSAALYHPVGGYAVTPADLAAIGIVPNDTTPPVVSIQAAIFDPLTGDNQTASGLQIWVILRYAGAAGSLAMTYGNSSDVTFANGRTGYSYYTAGDTRWSTLTGTFVDDGVYRVIKRQNIPIPATLNGQALTGIIIMGIGATATLNAPTTIRMCRAAVVAGATIDSTKQYFNGNDKVSASSTSTASNTRTLTIANSDKIGFNGDSYTESIYSPVGKNWVSKVGAFSDWRVVNLGTAGDWFEAMTYKLRSNFSYHGASGQNNGIVHMVGMSETNEPSKNSLTEALANASIWVDTARALGVKPWLATEWIDGEGIGWGMALRTLAEQKNVGLIDVRQSARLFVNTQHANYYGAGHPGVRVNEVVAAPFDEWVAALGRPKQGIKIYRKRAGTAVTGVDDLLYNGEYVRAKLFSELLTGQIALNTADGSTAQYDLLAGTGYTTASVADEYRTLEGGGTVAFNDYALIEAVLDVQQKALTQLTLTLNDPTVSVWVKSATAAPYPSNTLYQGFTTTIDPAVVVGDVYTSSEANTAGNSQAYTVVGFGGGKVIMSPRLWAGNTGGAGTLTRTSGTGPASIAFTVAGTAFDPTWYNYQGKPPGHWVALTGSSGVFTLSGSALQGILDFDKVSFLVYKSAAYTLGAPVVTYTADRFGKLDYHVQDYRARATGTELLARNDFAAGFPGWTTAGSPTIVSTGDSTPLVDPPLNPTTGVQMTSCALIGSANTVQQALTFTQTYDRDIEIEIRVWPRFYPVENDGSITTDTFDYRQIEIDLINPANGIVATAQRRVGLWWRDTVFRTIIPAGQTAANIRISAVTDALQLAWVSVKTVR